MADKVAPYGLSSLVTGGTMDVQLPDGRVVRNVPKGTTRAQLVAKLAASGHAPVDRSGAVGTVDAGVRGFTDMATFGLSDKIVAGLDSVLPLGKLTNPNVKSVWETGDIGGAFRNNLNEEQRIAAEDQQKHGFARGVGQVAGAIAGPVPGRGMIAAGAKAVAKQAVRKGVAATVARTAAGMARVAGEGAIQSGLHGLGSGDSLSLTDRLARGAIEGGEGALGSLVGAGAVRSFGRAISPVVSPAVKKLADMGVIMTPGQRAGPGFRQWTENVAESVPGLGVAIRGAKRRGIEQFNKGAINAALKPIGAVLPKKAQAGRTAIEAAQEIVSNHYDTALAKVRAPVDHAFSSDLAATAASAAKLPPNAAKTFDYVMANKVDPLLSGGVMDGEAFQGVTRTLQGLASKADDGTVEGELLADHLKAARQHFIDLAQRHSPEGASDFLKANAAEANMNRIYKAAKGAHGDGVFTPQQLSTAAAAKGYGTTVKNAAAGRARMQDVADAAKSILPNTVPNSGTPERVLAGSLLTGIGGGAAAVNPAVAGLAIPALPYIPGLDAALQKFALRGQGKIPRLLAKEIGKRAYVGGMFGAPLALQVGK